jgi:hypothetical protein
MFDKTRNQINNGRWDNPHAFEDQVASSNLQPIRSENPIATGEHFSLYGSDHLRANIEPPSWQQFYPGDFLGVGPLNWDEIIDDDDDEVSWPDAGTPSGGRSSPGDDNDNDNKEGEEDTQGT